MALAAAAYQEGVEVGEAVSLELRDLLFEQGVDVGDPTVLAALAAEHGVAFDPPTAVATVRADHREGVERGVIGSPHFFTPEGSFYCPALDISRDEAGALHVEMDEAGFEVFLHACFSTGTA
jgi:2-hydroxychromene-2-carboxylate isomerase